MRYASRILVALLGCWCVAHSAWVSVQGLHDSVAPADCILIPGNTVNPDGSLSDRLRARLDKSLQLYRQRLAPKIVVSGGLGREGHYEGFVMGQYLLRQGVPARDIIVDDAGATTQATAANFAAIAAQRHFRSVIVVSQFFHLPRTRLLLEQAGRFRLYQAHAEYFELRDAYSLLREFPAYYRYALRF